MKTKGGAEGSIARLYYGEGTSREVLPTLEDSVDCIVTSPPYFGLRDYCGNEEQSGSGQTLDEYIEDLVLTFRAKRKDLVGVPWRVALALQADGWWLRNDIIWAKPNPMPSSAQDRCTVSHEYIFMLAKSEKYYFDADAIREPLAESTLADPRLGATGTGRERYGEGAACPSGFTGANMLGANCRTVWRLKPNSYRGGHFAVFPEELPRRCMLAGCPRGGTVLDVFSGSGTTGKVALSEGRNYIGIDVNKEYLELAQRRVSPLLSDVVRDENQMEMF